MPCLVAPTALLVNDDGIQAPGLRALAEALRAEGFEVEAAAPSGDASGSGKGIRVPFRLREARVEWARRAWTGDAPPASLVYALLRLGLSRPSVVASGVNHGPNLGLEDLFTSATIGGALEASFQGVPAVAVSHYDRSARDVEGLRLAARIGAALARWASRQLGEGEVIVVNVPRDPRGIAGVSVAWSRYMVGLVLGRDGLVTHTGLRHGDLYPGPRAPGTDLHEYERGRVTLALVRLLKPSGGVCTCPPPRGALEEARAILEGAGRGYPKGGLPTREGSGPKV